MASTCTNKEREPVPVLVDKETVDRLVKQEEAVVKPPKKVETFVSSKPQKKENYIKNLLHKSYLGIKLFVLRLYAPLNDHTRKPEMYKFAVDLLFTCLVCSFVAWCFGALFPLRKGFGIAVTITMTQYYLKWYWRNKRYK